LVSSNEVKLEQPIFVTKICLTLNVSNIERCIRLRQNGNDYPKVIYLVSFSRGKCLLISNTFLSTSKLINFMGLPSYFQFYREKIGFLALESDY